MYNKFYQYYQKWGDFPWQYEHKGPFHCLQHTNLDIYLFEALQYCLHPRTLVICNVVNYEEFRPEKPYSCCLIINNNNKLIDVVYQPFYS